MKKWIVTILLGLSLLIPAFALAQTGSGQQCSNSASNSGQLCNALPSFGGVSVGNLQDLIVAVMVWAGTLIATGAFVMILYAGGRMIIAQGDPKAISEAKSTIFYAIVGFVISIFAYVIVSAVEFFVGVKDQNGGSDFFYNPIQSPSLVSFVDRTITGFLGLVGTIAILYIIIGGFRYMTAGGNEEQAKKGRNSLTWAVVGLISVILSYTIIQVLRQTFVNWT